MNHDIFISYSRYDTNVVNEIVDLLEHEGYSVWIDRDGIESGDDFKRVILKAIKDSKVVIFFSSEHSNVSDWTAKEIGVAVKYKKHIIPIMLDDSNFNEAVEFDLINLDYIDFSKISLRTVIRERLLKTLKSKIGSGEQEKELWEAERKAKEEAERARLEKERIAKAEAERRAREAEERERIERERKAEEAKRKAEQERIERERREAEQKAKDASEKKRLSAFCGRKKDVPEGAINGVFSVSPTKKVYFSQGNLLYHPSTRIWRFADRQYDLPGQYKNIGPGWMYLFRWMSGDNPEKTPSRFIDWGNNRIVNGGNCEGIWETLSHDEWKYVFEERETLTGLRFAKALVEGVKGVVLFPDDWETDRIKIKKMNKGNALFGRNSINAEEWVRYEKDGAVFLPAAGRQEMQEIEFVGDIGHYWTTSFVDDKASAAYVRISGSYLDIDVGNRNNGMSVRLVCPIK